MKKIVLFILFGCLLQFQTAEAQNCRIIRDSIILGNSVSSYADYVYSNNKLIAVYHTDSGQTNSSYFDTAFYDNNSRLVKTEAAYYNGGVRYVQQTDTLIYNGNNQVIRAFLSGTNQNGPFTRAHDITYDGSGNITSMTLDPLAETGSPEGFPGSFGNIVWSAGNISTLNLIMGSDIIEIIVNTDNAPNALPKRFFEGAPDLLLNKMTNNMTTLVFANDENMGPAGTIAINYSYTYTINNDVLVEHRQVSLFESEEQKIQYMYDCSVGTDEIKISRPVVYPNPAGNTVSMDFNANDSYEIHLYNIEGQLLQTKTGDGGNAIIHLEDLSSGIYFLRVKSQATSFTQKISKQ